MKRNIIIIVIAAAILALVGTTGAVAAALVTSADIQDGTIRGKDLTDNLRSRTLADSDTGAAAFVVAPWNDRGIHDVYGDTAVVTADPATGSVETSALSIPTEAGDVIQFHYTLRDGATCSGGSPRMFVQIGDAFPNSWDQNIGNGVDAACGGVDQVVTFTSPGGTITGAGLVADQGTGSVVFDAVKIKGDTVLFN